MFLTGDLPHKVVAFADVAREWRLMLSTMRQFILILVSGAKITPSVYPISLAQIRAPSAEQSTVNCRCAFYRRTPRKSSCLRPSVRF
jgi:hypothetical protein